MTVGRSLTTIWLVLATALFASSRAESNEFLKVRDIDTPLTPALTAPTLPSAMGGIISMHAVEKKKESSEKKVVSQKDTVSGQQAVSAKKNDEYDGFADESEDGFEDDSEAEDGSSKRKAAAHEDNSEGNMESDSDDYSGDADLDEDSDDSYDRAVEDEESTQSSKKKQKKHSRKDEYDAEAEAQAAASDAAQQAHTEDSDSRQVKSEEDGILSDAADNERDESEAEDFDRNVNGDSEVDSCTDEECMDKKAKDDEDEEEDRKADDEKEATSTKSVKAEEETDEDEDQGDADSDQIEKEDDAIDSEAMADMEAQSELDSMDAGLNFFSAHPAKEAFGSALAAPANSVILHSPAPKAQSTGKQTNSRASSKSDVKKASEIKREPMRASEGENHVQTLAHSPPKTERARVLTQHKPAHARETKHAPAASTSNKATASKVKAAVAKKHALVQTKSDDIDNEDTDAGEESAISGEQDDAESEQDDDDATSDVSDDTESDAELDAESDSMIEGDTD